MVSRAILLRSSIGCHSNELSIFVTQEVLLYLLVTNLAARHCTASSFLVAAAVYGSQTVWLYTNKGRTSVLYAVWVYTSDVRILKFLIRVCPRTSTEDPRPRLCPQADEVSDPLSVRESAARLLTHQQLCAVW